MKYYETSREQAPEFHAEKNNLIYGTKVPSFFRYKIISIVALIAAISGQVGLAKADTLEERLNEVEQQQKILARQQELDKDAQKDTAKIVAGKEGFSFKSNDGKFALKLRGLIHADGRFFIDLPQRTGSSTFVARRVRPTFEGTVFERFDFRITPDFGSGATVLQDAYVDIKLFPELKIRGGKFKEPVGIERLKSSNNLLFVERSLANNLIPNRDVGFQIFGDILDERISYAFGVFNGVSDGGSTDGDNNDGKDIAGRLFFKPFLKTGFEGVENLGFGIAGTYGKQEGSTSSPNLPSFKSNGQLSYFKYRNKTGDVSIASGRIYRVTPQLEWTWGPLKVLGEYVRSSQQIQHGTSEQTLTNQAWQVAAAVVVTGEKESVKGVKPKKPFNPTKNQWGAVELVTRYNELRVDKDAFPIYADANKSPNQARAYGFGVNWFLNDNVKLVADYEQTLFKNASVATNRPTEKVIETRLELAF